MFASVAGARCAAVLAVAAVAAAQVPQWNSVALFQGTRDLAACYDLGRARIVIFGGQTASQTQTNATWEHDGTDWLPRTPLISPPPRSGHRLAYDLARGRTVLFGGGTGLGTYFSDTWEWDGASWQQCTPA